MNARSGAAFQPGIGPHTETATVAMVVEELRRSNPAYSTASIDVPYPNGSRQKCDVCIGPVSAWEWTIEVKMLRMMGDNGKPNDNMITHILSPYPCHRSAVTDSEKLVAAGLAKRAGLLIYAYQYDAFPAEPAIAAFERLCADRVVLAPRHTAVVEGLVHPVHQRGAVYGWEIVRPVVRPQIRLPDLSGG